MTAPDPRQIGCGGWTPPSQSAEEKADDRLALTACSPLARKMMEAAKSRKGDLFGDAAQRVIRVADEGMNLYEIAQWNNVVDVLRELSKFTENTQLTDAPRSV